MADNKSFSLFGFEFKRKEEQKNIESFVPPDIEDGSVVVTQFGSHISYSVDIDQNSFKFDSDLIQRYREISNYAEVDIGIDEIVNEAIVYTDTEQSVNIDFDSEFTKKYSENTKATIEEEFRNILKLLNFSVEGNDIFRRWYIDGRLPYHKIIDSKNTKDGIKELRYIDPTKLKKVVEIKKTKNAAGIEIIEGKDEYFVYNEKGFTQGEKVGVKIAKDSICWITSGLYEPTSGTIQSYLHKAIRPTNQLKMMEDATIIYTLARAPERRIFYIDTSDMTRTKAEEYIRQVMARYRNKQVYDAATGNVKDDKKHMSMLEDFWLPRKSNGRGTEVSTLPGGQGLVSPELLDLFKNKLFQSLNVPLSRLQQGATFNIGRSNEITRDEIKFSKFVDKLRKRFNFLFLDLLKTQLILKGITNIEDWEEIQNHIYFNYNKDNIFSELKDSELIRERINTLMQIQPFIGTYFSQRYVMKDILRMTDSEIDEMQKEIAKEPKPEKEEDSQ